uniref:RNA polymerase I specific transcription initiation factor RRN3 n=2 Tax=Toxoplasma gondii TaxID=5811 RepID=A0A2T6INV8_TOXGO|nr:RNA polymerase I specific transcription initiation factor RRN3 [Toxoplasma gondii TgCATBr9]
MTSIDVEIKLADPNSIDLEQMQVWKREQLALLARQLEKGAVAPSVVQSILGEPQWFCLMYEKVRSEEDIDIMAAKLDGLMRVSFSFLQCFIPQLSGKPAPPGAYREEEDERESVGSPSSRSSVADYSPCVDDEPKEEKKRTGTSEKDPRGDSERRSCSEERRDSPSPFSPQSILSPQPAVTSPQLASTSPRGGPSAFPASRHTTLAPRDPRRLLSPALSPAPAWPPDAARGPPGLRDRSRETRRDKKPLTEADVLVYELMDVFVEVVLPVHKCKYVQFLVFYLANLRVEWAGRLMSLLFRMLFDRQQHMLLRRISAVYISSFLCRALLVPPRFVRLALHHFLQLLHRGFLMTGTPNAPRQQQRLLGLLRAQHQTVYNPESPLALFYTVCQSCCYILCYHLDALAKSAPSLAFLKERNTSVAALLTSPLRPLMHIKRGIAREFVAACRRVGSLDSSSDFENALKEVQLRDPPPSSCYRSSAGENEEEEEGREEREAERGEDEKERGKRISQVDAVSSNDLLSDVLWLFDPLDAFFPFDRYLLRHSGRFIANKYRDWSAVVAFVMQREEEKKKGTDGPDSRDPDGETDKGAEPDREKQRGLSAAKSPADQEERQDARSVSSPSMEPTATAQNLGEKLRRAEEAQLRNEEAPSRRSQGEENGQEDLDGAGVLFLTVDEEGTDSDAEKEEVNQGEKATGPAVPAGAEDKKTQGAGASCAAGGDEDAASGTKEKGGLDDENPTPSLAAEKSANHTPPIVTQQPQHNLSRELATSEMGALQQLVQDSLGFASVSRELEAKVRQRAGSSSGAAKLREERRATLAGVREKKRQGFDEEAETGRTDEGDGVFASGSPELGEAAVATGEEGGCGEGRERERGDAEEEGEEEEGDDERCIGNESDDEGWGDGKWDSLSALFSDEERELEERDFQEDREEESDGRTERALPVPSSEREDPETMTADEAGDQETQARRHLHAQSSCDSSSTCPGQIPKNVGPSLRRSRVREAKREFSFLAPRVAASIADQLELEVDAVGDEALSQSNLCLLRHQSCLSRASMLDIFLSSQAYRPAPASPVVSAAASPFLMPSQAPPLTDLAKPQERQHDPLASPPTLAIVGEPTEPVPVNFVLTPAASFVSPSVAFSSAGFKGTEVESEANRVVDGREERWKRQLSSARSEERGTGGADASLLIVSTSMPSLSLGVIQEHDGEAGADDANEKIEESEKGETEEAQCFRDREKSGKRNGRRRSADAVDESVDGEEAREATRQETEVTKTRLKRRHTVNAFAGFPSRPPSGIRGMPSGEKPEKKALAEVAASGTCPSRSPEGSPEASGEASEREASRDAEGEEACLVRDRGEAEAEREMEAGGYAGTHQSDETEVDQTAAVTGEKRGKNEGEKRRKKKGEKDKAEKGLEKRARDAEHHEQEAPEEAEHPHPAADKSDAGKATTGHKQKMAPSSSAGQREVEERLPSICVLPCLRETGGSSSPGSSSVSSSSGTSSQSPLSFSPSALSPSLLCASSYLQPPRPSASATAYRSECGVQGTQLGGDSPFSLGSEDRKVSQLDRVLHSLREREEQLKAQQAEVQRTQEALMKMLLHEKQKREERRKKKERRRQEAAKTQGDSDVETDMRRQSEEPSVSESGLKKVEPAAEEEEEREGESPASGGASKKTVCRGAGQKQTGEAPSDNDGHVLSTASVDQPGTAERGKKKTSKKKEREHLEEEAIKGSVSGGNLAERGAGEPVEPKLRKKRAEGEQRRSGDEQVDAAEEDSKKYRKKKEKEGKASSKNVEAIAERAESGSERGVSPESRPVLLEQEEWRTGEKKQKGRKLASEAKGHSSAGTLELRDALRSLESANEEGTERKKKKKRKPKCLREDAVAGEQATETAPGSPPEDRPDVTDETAPVVETSHGVPTSESATEKKKRKKKGKVEEMAGDPAGEDSASAVCRTEELALASEEVYFRGTGQTVDSATGIGEESVERKKKKSKGKKQEEAGNAPRVAGEARSREEEVLDAGGEQETSGETESGCTGVEEGRKKRKKKKKREVREEEEPEGEDGEKKAKTKRKRTHAEKAVAGQNNGQSGEAEEGEGASTETGGEQKGGGKEGRKIQARRFAEICDEGSTTAAYTNQEAARGKVTLDEERRGTEHDRRQAESNSELLHGEGESGKKKKKKKVRLALMEAGEEAKAQELAAEEVDATPMAYETSPVLEEETIMNEKQKKKDKKKRKREETGAVQEGTPATVADQDTSAASNSPAEGTERDKEKVKQPKKKRKHEERV